MYRSIIIIFAISLLTQCAQKEEKKGFSFKEKQKSTRQKASTFVDLENKGIGPISSVSLSEEIDSERAKQGKGLYTEKCTTCHRLDSVFIGPSLGRVLERRAPEWIMNMVLNTEEMLQKDSLARALFMEFDGQLMTNQKLTENQARDILEYLRSL